MQNSRSLKEAFDFAIVKVNFRRHYSRILAEVCAAVMANGVVKIFCIFEKNPVVRFCSSFAHYELTLNPFCQHCSNKI